MVERPAVNRLVVGSSPTDLSTHVRVVQGPSTPVFPTGNMGSIPITDASRSCRCRIAASTPVSRTGDTGSIPVTDTQTWAEESRIQSDNSLYLLRVSFRDLARLRSPCWAPRRLIPVCATVRFRRLRLVGSLPIRNQLARREIDLESRTLIVAAPFSARPIGPSQHANG